MLVIFEKSKATTLKYALILLFICFAACVKSKNEACPNTPQYQSLTTSAKEWLPYTNSKSLVFENTSLANDTLELLNLFIGDDTVWTGDKCPFTKGEFIKVNIFDRKSNDTINTQVGLEDELRIFTKRNNIVFYDTKNILIEPSSYKRFETSLTLNGKAFTSVLALECSPDDHCVSTGITKIYFSKKFGLVAYERNGVLWTLK